jgi:hypothetical protein
MFIDKSLMFHDDTAITTATEYKGDSITLLTVGSMLRESRGEGLEVIVQCTSDFATLDSLEVETVTANDAALTSEIGQYGTKAVTPIAQCVAGKKWRFPVGMNLADADATHFGVQITAAGSTGTGSLSAWIQRVGEDQDSRY